jgi:hypothetical protein
MRITSREPKDLRSEWPLGLPFNVFAAGRTSRSRRAIVVSAVLLAPALGGLTLLGSDRRLFAGDEMRAIGTGLARAILIFATGYAQVVRRSRGSSPTDAAAVTKSAEV